MRVCARKEVVVSGIGIISSLGREIETVWTHLLEGKNGFTALSDPAFLRYGIQVAGLAAEFSLDRFHIRPKLIKEMNFGVKMLVYAGLSALEAASLKFPEETEAYNVGAIVGAGNALVGQHDNFPYEQRPPTWFLETFPNMPLAYLSLAASIKGYGSTIVSACVSSTQAIGNAFKLIQSGQAKIVVAGGMENKLVAPALSGFSRLHMVDSEKDPEKAMRPFDKTRSGFVIGQGACLLVLEEYEHACKRGVSPMGRIVGYGASLSANSLTDACRLGVLNSMRAALEDAHLSPQDIDYINAHGTATLSNDREESLAIKELFGESAYRLVVNSTKSMLGHTFAACGALESAVCIKSLQARQVHPTRNFQLGDSNCDLDYVKGEARKIPIRYCMSNNSGLGGYNATLIFGQL